jgi:hypothetical protein
MPANPTTARFHLLSYSRYTAYKRSESTFRQRTLFLSELICVSRADSRRIGRSCETVSSWKSAFNFVRRDSKRALCRWALSRPDAGIRCALAEADHLVHISVQEIEFRAQIRFHRRHSSTGGSACHESKTISREFGFRAHSYFPAQSASLFCHGLYLRRFPNRRRREESKALRARGELRGEWEMDNFSCSHCCTSGATLVRGALVLIAPARPATQDSDFFVRLALLLFFPWPQYFVLLYSFPLASSDSVQYVISTPAITSTKGAGANFL